MNITRSVTLILLIVFCLSVTVAFSEPVEKEGESWEIIKDKWLDYSTADGITKYVKDPVKILKHQLNNFKNFEIRSKIQFLLGECYYFGIGTTVDKSIANDYYSMSAKSGYDFAKVMLNVMCLQDESSIISKEEAEKYIEKIKDLNSGEYRSKWKLAETLLVFIKGTKIISEKKAKKLIKLAADNGVEEAKSLITLSMELWDNRVAELEKLAENGKKEAMLELAYIFISGDDGLYKKDKEKAKIWMAKYQHELDSVLDKEVIMLNFYNMDDSIDTDLVTLQAKKIIYNLPSYEVSELNSKLLQHLIFCYLETPLIVLENSVRKDEEIEVDKDFDEYYNFIEPIWDNLCNELYYSNSFNNFSKLADEENKLWFNAVKKFNSIHNENVKTFKYINDYIDKVGLKVNSEMDLEEYNNIKKDLKEYQSYIEQREPAIQMWLFDVPIQIASKLTLIKINDSKIPLTEKKSIATNFSKITVSALPYTVLDESRTEWFETSKAIKNTFSQEDYKELHNKASKLLPSIVLPKSFDMKWPD